MLKFLKTYWFYIFLPLVVFVFVYQIFFSKKFSAFNLGLDNQYKNIARSLYTAMNQFGTNETIIFEKLLPLSESDFKKVYDAFGLRFYNPSFGHRTLDFADDKMDLIQWLSNELTNIELSRLRNTLPYISYYGI